MKCFKKCPLCGEEWNSLFLYLNDKKLHLNGYQADFELPDMGLFYFTHKKEKCDTTMVLEVEKFLSLYKGERHNESRFGMDDCSGLCLDKSELGKCESKCKYAYVREIIQKLKAK